MSKIMKLNKLLGILLLVVSVGALPAGLMMIIGPDGKSMGLSVDALKNSPFNSFLVPGLFLFIVNGIFNFTGGILCLRNHRLTSAIGLSLGTIMILWIIIQVLIIGLNSILQPLYLCIGIIEVIISIFLRNMEKRKNISIQEKII